MLVMAGRIAEKLRLPINGVAQGMFIRGRDATLPVLLFLHGGPGMPEYFLDRTHPTGLENDFVVCWWEQRGAGLSHGPGIPPESLTVEQPGWTRMRAAAAASASLGVRSGPSP